jgi:hypothetical protein
MGLPFQWRNVDHFGYAKPPSSGWDFSVERQQVVAGTIDDAHE